MSDDKPSPLLTAVYTWQAIIPTTIYAIVARGLEPHVRDEIVRYILGGIVGACVFPVVLALRPVYDGQTKLFLFETVMCFLGATLCIDTAVLILQGYFPLPKYIALRVWRR